MVNISRLAFAWLFAALAVIGGAAASAWAQPVTVVVGSEGVIPPLDPHRLTGTVGFRITDAIYDPLIREDLSEKSDLAPALKGALAESWTVSSDGLTYSFKLRQNVKFHDGTPFNAAAVQTNFDRLMDKNSPLYDARAAGNMTFLTRWIKSTAVRDPSTFEIVLKEPFGGLPRLLSDRHAVIVSPAALNEYKGDKVDQLASKPVGTGPFTLANLQQGQPVTLTRFDGFWGTKPQVERYVFQPILDPTAMAIAMQTGQIDLIPSASAQQVAQLKSQPGIEVQYPEPASAFYLRLNMKTPPMNDIKVRQALNYAVNRDNIVALFDGQVTSLATPVPFGNEIFRPGDLRGYTYDPAKAKSLLAEAGVKTPLTIKMITANSGPGFALAPQVVSLLQQDFQAVGIDFQVRFLEFTTLLSTESPGFKEDINGTLNGWTTGTEQAYWLERMFSSAQQPPSGINRGWYSNPAVDKLFDAARAETDQAKRNDIYRKAAAQILEDAPLVYLYQDKFPRIIGPRLTGIVQARSVFLDYTRINKK